MGLNSIFLSTTIPQVARDISAGIGGSSLAYMGQAEVVEEEEFEAIQATMTYPDGNSSYGGPSVWR